MLNIRCTTPAEIAKHIQHLCGGGEGAKSDGGQRVRPGVSFLLGAGFSRSAGILTAGETVEKFLRTHSLLSGVGTPPPGQSEYAFLMSQLPPAERTKIIREVVNGARGPGTHRLRINWAHLLLAALVDRGFVSLILTTNFDPLAVEALAITGQPARTFDLTAAGSFQPGILEAGTVVYVHGQSHGLWLANTESEAGRVRDQLPIVLNEATRGSALIVVGYSGENDPVLDELAKIRQFPHRLYWVHHSTSSNEPCKQAMKILGDCSREAFLVERYDADGFMREFVLEGLKVDLPGIVLNPLKAVSESLGRVMPLPPRAGRPPGPDPVESARELVAEARQLARGKAATSSAARNVRSSLAIRIAMAGAKGNLERLDELRRRLADNKGEKIQRRLGDALLSAVSGLVDRRDFQRARQILDDVENLGTSEPHWLAVMWGNYFHAQAKAENGDGADRLFALAYQKYDAALRIKPDMCEAFSNWGTALAGQARLRAGAEADILFKQACEKFAAAIKVKPDLCEAQNNWGTALADQARLRAGAEADILFKQACEKFAAAIRVKPDLHESLLSWGDALATQARAKGGAESDALFEQACEKYAAAIRIKPDVYWVLYSWGNALYSWAKTKCGAVADTLFEQACEKYDAAIKANPQSDAPYFNLACVAGIRGDVTSCLRYLQGWRRCCQRPTRQAIDDDHDFDAVRDTAAFQDFRASLPE